MPSHSAPKNKGRAPARPSLYTDANMQAAKYFPLIGRAVRRPGAAVDDAKQLATLLDDGFRIPGTGIRFGWEPIIGLIPGVGDSATAILSLAPVVSAWRVGASRWLLARMIVNVGVDTAIGAIPVVGDVFDLFFRSNRRNARLLEKHLASAGRIKGGAGLGSAKVAD